MVLLEDCVCEFVACLWPSHSWHCVQCLVVSSVMFLGSHELAESGIILVVFWIIRGYRETLQSMHQES